MRALILAIQVLAPLIEQVIEYFKTGKEPEFLTTLPKGKTRSRVALEAARARKALGA